MNRTEIKQAMELMVNKHAKDNLCRKHGVSPDHFQIHMSEDIGDNISSVIPGHIVQIHLKWPEVIPTMNSVIHDCLSLIARYKLRRTLEIVPYAYMRDWNNKWKREMFQDESDIVMDMLPKHRLKISESTTITLEDSVTGETISITKSGKKERFEGEDVTLWIQLSRIVRDKHPILETIVEDKIDDNNASNASGGAT